MTENQDHHPSPENNYYQQQRRFARECILQILYQKDADHDAQWTDLQAHDFWEQVEALEEPQNLARKKQVRKFTGKMIEGILREKEELDRLISNAASNWAIERMSLIDRNILRLAVYEIMFREDIPPIASINEALELAKKFGDRQSARFINGILDRILRDKS